MKILVAGVANAIGILAVLLGTAWATAAYADPSEANQAEIDQIRRVSAAFGRCVVARATSAASQFVLSQGIRRAVNSDGNPLFDPDCLKAQPGDGVDMLSSTSLYFAYEFADALVRKRLASFNDDLKSAPLTAFEKIGTATVVAEAAPNESSSQLAKEQAIAAAMTRNSLVDLFGYCVVRADSKNAHALLMTDVTTTAEQAEFEALQPAMNGCLAKGQQIKSDMTSLRGTIAVAYYRLVAATNPRLVPGSKVKD